MGQEPLEYIAILKDDLRKSGLTMKYLYFDGDGNIRDYSKRIALSPNVKIVIICYKTVMNHDYVECKEMLELGKLTPLGIQELLS